MKKIFNILSVVATFATALTACSTSDIDQTINPDTNTLTLIIETESPSRTVFDDTLNNGKGDVKWSGKETMAVLFPTENKKTAKPTLAEDGSATFTYTSAIAAAGTYTINGLLPNSAYHGEMVKRSEDKVDTYCWGIELPSEQRATSASFDAEADIMVAQPITINLTQEDIDSNNKAVADKFRFCRPFAVTKFMFTKATTENNPSLTAGILAEKVAKVKIETSAYALAGRVRFNPSKANFVGTDGTTILAESESDYPFAGNKSNAVIVNIADDQTVGDLTAWAVTNAFAGSEGTITFTITTTAGTTITREIALSSEKAMNIKRNALNTVPVSLANANVAVPAPVDPSRVYTLVTDASTLTAGDMLVIACNTENVVAGNWNTGAYYDKTDATFSADLTTLSLPTDATIFTLGGEEGKWTLRTPELKYFGWESGTTMALYDNPTDVNAQWGSISIAENGNATVSLSAAERTIRYNSGSKRFTTYSSGETAVQLYRAPAEVAAIVTATTGAASDCESEAGETATVSGSYTWSGNGSVTVGFEYKSGADDYTSVNATINGTSFSANLTGLTAGTEYTFRAWVSLDGGTTKVYGNEDTFTPTATSGGDQLASGTVLIYAGFEKFGTLTGAAAAKDISDYQEGWSGDVYNCGLKSTTNKEYIRLGTTSVAKTITTPAFGHTVPFTDTTDCVLSFGQMGWKDETINAITLTIVGNGEFVTTDGNRTSVTATKPTKYGNGDTSYGDFDGDTYEVTITGADKNTQVTFSSKATFIDEVYVTVK